MVWYTGVDQQRYDAGEKFLPQDRFLLNYTSPTTGTEEEEQVTTSQGIPNTNAFINAGGGGGSNMGGLNQTWFTEPGAPATSQGDYDIYGNKINELGRTGILGAWDKTKDFFSGLGTPKVRGTLGDRLANQPRLPLPGAIASWSLSPFNTESGNYNPLFKDQLNFLETQDNMIGRDPNSGLMKYGPDSVLSGKNVISMFGTNDYEEALQNKIDWFENRISLGKKISWDNYHQALAEQQKANVLENERQKALQEKIAQEAMKGKSLSQIGKENFTGEGMAFAPRQDTFTKGKTIDSPSTPGGKYGSPKKDGGLIGYNRGGLATMFTRRR